ncbi:MAG TPA: YkgJ family cysteine cluster protein, partial [Desulfurivibrionaceae bacterium]|nr:YkgJ family cysteine cluster protein [Desulfurivibrionaceae bacterium]
MIDEIYQAFADESSGVDFACGPGCATCCTRSVTLTTGEGRLILDFLRRMGRSLPELPRDPAPLRPALTTNGLAGSYLAGQVVLNEPESPWLFEPCVFLREGLCSIYEIRPFACRSLVSTVNCKNTGMAEAPERLVTLAIVTNQLLEGLDRGGFWGNLADVLAFLDEGAADASRLAAR